MTIDLGTNLDDVDVDDNFGGPMPIADYYARVVEAEEKTSQNGNAMIELQFKLEGNEKYDGKLFWHYVVFGLEHSLESLKRTMSCLGMDTSNTTSVNASQFVGKTCRIHNKHEEYNGEMKERVHFLKPYKSSSEEGPQPVVSATDAAPPIGDDDSIPF